MRRLLPDAVTIAFSVVLGLALSLWLTPMQSVAAAGQEIQVGVTAPSWAWSGSGELDLFGQRIPTVVQFTGPVRPRLRLTRITLGQQVSQFAASPSAAAHALQESLVTGWKRFFLFQLLVAAACIAALAGAATGWLRRPHRRAVVIVVVAVVLGEVLDVAAIMVTAYTAPGKLRTIRSVQALVGGSPPAVVRPPPAAAGTARHVVVLGDSTAAGQGNALVADPSADDRACHRSAEAFAAVLDVGADLSVTNLACGGATIRAGLLGEQTVGGLVQPPQVDRAATADADVVILSIGANDVHWADLLRLCAVSASCSNRAETAYLQQQLSGFSRDYLQLLSTLQVLPKHPPVVVNLYFDPFVGDVGCLASVGMTAAKQLALHADLAALNEILEKGALAAGFSVARPDFTAHGICAAHSYVQGLDAPAPFHPTPSGELAIALADERALRSA